MTFLNTIMLGGLAAIAIPILIHLLNRRRFRKVMWAAMRFIAASVEKNKRRMEIEDLILLALRCLIVALIALALARPTLRNVTAGFLGGGRTAGILLLDNSLSMGMSDGTSTRLDKAKRAAEQAIDSLPQGSSVAVWLVSDIVRDVIPEPTFDLNLARKSVREAALSDRATELAAAIDRGVETLLKRVGSRREIYLFTDGQLEGWRGLLDIKSRLDKVRDQVRAHVVLISEKDQKNISVRDLRLASGLAPAGQSLRFDIQVQNHGSQPASNVRVSIASGTERSSD
ncbi:MAG: VWA domain-containing protein, partial [Verrucomicrobia bacterium]|nr:VWA domain-containing protein [Verrucomicrobiota bacterium]